jgi:hypothetical protein
MLQKRSIDSNKEKKMLKIHGQPRSRAFRVLYTLAPLKYDLSKYPGFDAWLKASIERPAAKEARKPRE